MQLLGGSITFSLTRLRSRKVVRRSLSLSHPTFHHRHCGEDYKIFVGGGKMFSIGFNMQTALVEVFRRQIVISLDQDSNNWQNHSLLLGHSWMQCTAGDRPCRARAAVGQRQRCSPIAQGRLRALCWHLLLSTPQGPPESRTQRTAYKCSGLVYYCRLGTQLF